MTKKECEKALENLRVLERKDNFKKWGGQVAPQINCDVVEQLIKDHFESKENTLEFKNFKLYKNNTLKSMSKDELINYVHVLHHNWSVSTEQLFNVIKIYNKLQDELDVIKNLQPYKFEELKKGMWVWDDDKKQCIECAPGKNVMGEKCVWHWYDYDFEGELSEDYIEFEDGRFYPIMKAYYYNQQRR